MSHGIEELYGCFNATADIWDKKFGVEPDDPFCQAVANQIPTTQAEVDILNLGYGTSIQLEYVFARAPNARVTGIGLAPNMLEQLKSKFGSFAAQLGLVQGALLDLSLGEEGYDYAISTLTIHHLPPEHKVRV
jgi:tRNA (cmo5U34)-methyltransferase